MRETESRDTLRQVVEEYLQSRPLLVEVSSAFVVGWIAGIAFGAVGIALDGMVGGILLGICGLFLGGVLGYFCSSLALFVLYLLLALAFPRNWWLPIIGMSVGGILSVTHALTRGYELREGVLAFAVISIVVYVIVDIGYDVLSRITDA